MKERYIFSWMSGTAIVLAVMVALVFTLIAKGRDVSFADNPTTFASEEWERFKLEHEPMLDEILKAYNEESYEAFVKDLSIQRHKLTKRAFMSLWCHDYKGKYGDYMSKEFFAEKSNPNKTYPLLTYRAKFSKNEETGIRCVFTKDDDGEYRIFYLRFDPYQDLFY